jgi:hypothetical protein
MSIRFFRRLLLPAAGLALLALSGCVVYPASPGYGYGYGGGYGGPGVYVAPPPVVIGGWWGGGWGGGRRWR